jgi:hypothetical protein
MSSIIKVELTALDIVFIEIEWLNKLFGLVDG